LYQKGKSYLSWWSTALQDSVRMVALHEATRGNLPSNLGVQSSRRQDKRRDPKSEMEPQYKNPFWWRYGLLVHVRPSHFWNQKFAFIHF